MWACVVGRIFSLTITTPLGFDGVDNTGTYVSPPFYTAISIQGGEYQKSFSQLVSAWGVACLAVVTLIKDS